jgi:hypothetical protein
MGLSVDATRELAKCANGELVSHEIVRDGIDALLQLKSATYDTTPRNEKLLDTPQQETLRSCPDGMGNVEAIKEESEEEDEDEEHDDDCSTCRSPSPPPAKKPRVSRKQGRKPTTIPRPAKPTSRPPTIWHHRKNKDTATITPVDTPKSKASPRDSSDADDEEGPSGPAILHFSCLQCHRAKKKCDRTHPCSRCVIRGMEDECGYPDKHDPRSVLRACLRCWQTKKKCDRKQPGCGKCDKVGVKCMYRREVEAPEVFTAGVL